MRRIDLLFGGALVLLLVAALLAFGPERDSLPKRDKEVIEASLLAFFEKTAWNKSDWSKGDFVVVDPIYSATNRSAFSDGIDGLINEYKLYKSTAVELRELQRIKTAHPSKSMESKEPPAPLAAMGLDSRIVIQKYERDIFSFKSPSVTNRLGKKGVVRVSGTLSAPSYSEDGNAAILSLTGVPWSRHSATVRFILERQNGKWKVVQVLPIFFL